MDTTAQDSGGHLLKETAGKLTAQHPDRTQGLTEGMIEVENQIIADTGGVSGNNRDKGFASAFRDNASGRVYRSKSVPRR